MRLLALMCGLLLSACSLVLPHPTTSSDSSTETPILSTADPQPAPPSACSLDLQQARKSVPLQPGVAGVPAPLIVREYQRGSGPRTLQSGQGVYFVPTRPGTGSNRNVELDPDRRAVQDDIPGAVPPAAVWQIEVLDAGGAALGAQSPLRDGATIRLHSTTASGYLQLNGAAPNTAAPAAAASQLLIYKADVPDASHASTCDLRIRDGDFIYLRTTEPGIWVDASSSGMLGARPAPAAGAAAACARSEQRCRGDGSGGFVCAWAPACSD